MVKSDGKINILQLLYQTPQCHCVFTISIWQHARLYLFDYVEYKTLQKLIMDEGIVKIIASWHF